MFKPTLTCSLALCFVSAKLTLFGMTAQAHPMAFPVDQTIRCEVIIAGGSTAALAAALTSARQKKKTCLLEPTDWAGGQLTASGSSAIDFASHSIGGRSINSLAKHPKNNPRELFQWLRKMGPNPGQCWVSEFCYAPQNMLKRFIQPAIAKEVKAGYLFTFYNTVVKSLESSGRKRKITSIYGIQRKPKQGNGYQRFLSESLADWYDPESSPEFAKAVLKFSGPQGKLPSVIDASEFGDILVLSGADFLQSYEHVEGDLYNMQSRCGQAHVFPFVMAYHSKKTPEPPLHLNLPEGSQDYYSNKAFQRFFQWPEIWSYRRIYSRAKFKPKDWQNIKVAHPGDLSLQNWNPGNDYPFGYLFKSKQQTLAEIPVWQGGINLKALKDSEQHALGWYQWLKNKAPAHIKDKLSLNYSSLGTDTGLSKLPYIRDTRRSIGIGHFILTLNHLRYKPGQRTGTFFKDRVGLGIYKNDLHPLKCMYPALTRKIHPIAPYYLPYRAITNNNFDNLLVAGKTMAQSFVANSSTRVHMIEWSSGVAAGVAGAHMFDKNLSNWQAAKNIKVIQQEIKKYSPIDWSF